MNNNMLKIGVTAVAETGWQYGAQYLDSQYSDVFFGIPDSEIAVSDLNAILYPVFFGLLAWQAASYYTKDNKDANDNDKNDAKKIGLNILLGMAGWTVGYYVADACGLGRWMTALSVGAGSALPSLFLNGYQYVNDSSNVTATSVATIGAAMFAGGFLWYTDYLIPTLVGAEGPTNEIMKSVVAPAATLVTTAMCMWLAVRTQPEPQGGGHTPQSKC